MVQDLANWKESCVSPRPGPEPAYKLVKVLVSYLRDDIDFYGRAAGNLGNSDRGASMVSLFAQISINNSDAPLITFG